MATLLAVGIILIIICFVRKRRKDRKLYEMENIAEIIVSNARQSSASIVQKRISRSSMMSIVPSAAARLRSTEKEGKLNAAAKSYEHDDVDIFKVYGITDLNTNISPLIADFSSHHKAQLNDNIKLKDLSHDQNNDTQSSCGDKILINTVADSNSEVDISVRVDKDGDVDATSMTNSLKSGNTSQAKEEDVHMTAEEESGMGSGSINEPKIETDEKSDDNELSVAEKTDDNKSNVAEKSDVSKLAVAEKSDDNKSSVAEKSDDSKLAVAENSDDSKPAAGDKSDTNKLKVNEKLDDNKLTDGEKSDDDKLTVSEKSDDDKLSVNEKSDDRKSTDTSDDDKMATPKNSDTSDVKEASHGPETDS